MFASLGVITDIYCIPGPCARATGGSLKQTRTTVESTAFLRSGGAAPNLCEGRSREKGHNSKQVRVSELNLGGDKSIWKQFLIASY